MKKPAKVLIIYLFSLLVFSLIFSWMGIDNFQTDATTLKSSFSPLMIVTIVGGIISLKYTVSKRSLKLFLIIYGCLWILRFGLIFASNQIGEAFIFKRKFHSDLIISAYFENILKLSTPFPFIIFWLTNNFFLIQKKTEV